MGFFQKSKKDTYRFDKKVNGKMEKLLLVYKLRTLLALALLLNSYKVKARAVCRGSGYERDRLPARLANMKEEREWKPKVTRN